MQPILISRLRYNFERPLAPDRVNQLRGYIAHQFPQHSILHNHDQQSGQCQYRYPEVQYQIIHGQAWLIGIGKLAAKVLEEVYQQISEVLLGKELLAITKKNIEQAESQIGETNELRQYITLTPVVALPDNAHADYRQLPECEERSQIVARSMVGHILRVAKACQYWVDNPVVVYPELEEITVNIKNRSLLGFTGTFFTNFYLPDMLAIGKSCGRGFGCCLDVTEA